MKTVKVLSNQNKIYNEVTNNTSYSNVQDNFSMHFVLQGHQRFRFGKRNITVHPGSFLVINEGTIFSSSIYSELPVNTFSIVYSPAFLKAFHRDYLLSDAVLLDEPFGNDDSDT